MKEIATEIQKLDGVLPDISLDTKLQQIRTLVFTERGKALESTVADDYEKETQTAVHSRNTKFYKKVT